MTSRIRGSTPRILFTSLSGKVALYQAVLRQSRLFHHKSKVLGVDCNPQCPAANQVDLFRTVPPLDSISDDNLLDDLQKMGITHILPSRDGELHYWSSRQPLLQQNGYHLLCSQADAIGLCEDKVLLSQLKMPPSLNAIPCFSSTDQAFQGNWVVKERRDSASRAIKVRVTATDAENLASQFIEPIFQPFIVGREFTAESWLDRSSTCRAVVLRWREKVVNGESHKTTIFQNPLWEEVIRQLLDSIDGLHGHCLVQVIVGQDQQLHLVEINPRLGGASPLSLSAGLNSILWSLQETNSPTEVATDFNPRIGATLTKIEGSVFISNP
jgi:carbamoyl-phosphate synthase large subunit